MQIARLRRASPMRWTFAKRPLSTHSVARRLLTFSLLNAAVWGSFIALPANGYAEEKYPDRPVTFIVPWGPGGGADQLARTGGKLLEPELGVSLPVINVPGATGQTGLAKLLSSPTDGYSLGVLTGDTFALFASPTARFKLDEMIPLGIMIQQPSGFYVKIDSPWKTWDDVLKAAKEKELRVAVTGFGSPDDITVNYFRKLGLKLQSVPFPKPGLRYSSIVGGQSDLLYEQAGDVRGFLDGKQIRPVIFFSTKPFGLFPNIPYSAKLGYNITLPQFRALILRAGTSPAVVATLSKAVDKLAKSPEYADYIKQQYGEPDSYVPAKGALPFMHKWLEDAKKLLADTKTQ